MQNSLSPKSGYQKVSISLMLLNLLNPGVMSDLKQVQTEEILRINRRYDRTSYISKAENNYLTSIYIDVVLNNSAQQTLNKKIDNIRVISPEIISDYFNNKNANKSIFQTL